MILLAIGCTVVAVALVAIPIVMAVRAFNEDNKRIDHDYSHRFEESDEFDMWI